MTVEERAPLAAEAGRSWPRPRAPFAELAPGSPGTNGEGHPVPLRIPNVAIHDALICGACAIVVLVVVMAPALLLYTAIVARPRPRGLAHDASTPGGPDVAPSGDAPAAAAPTGASRRAAVASWNPGHGVRPATCRVAGINYRVINNRSESPLWTAVVAAASHECQKPGMGDYDYRHAWWLPPIPCSRV